MIDIRRLPASDILYAALFLGAAALLVACHGTSKSATAAAPAHIRKPPPVARVSTPEQLTAGMVEAVTLGKSSVPVGVKFDIPRKPMLGQPTEIIIAVMPQIEAGPAVISVSGSQSLVLAADGAGPIEITSVDPSQVYRYNVTLTPTAEGVQVLALSVSLKHDEITETRAFSVPVIVAALGKP